MRVASKPHNFVKLVQHANTKGLMESGQGKDKRRMPEQRYQRLNPQRKIDVRQSFQPSCEIRTMSTLQIVLGTTYNELCKCRDLPKSISNLNYRISKQEGKITSPHVRKAAGKNLSLS